jgi:hypothetical protein
VRSALEGVALWRQVAHARWRRRPNGGVGYFSQLQRRPAVASFFGRPWVSAVAAQRRPRLKFLLMVVLLFTVSVLFLEHFLASVRRLLHRTETLPMLARGLVAIILENAFDEAASSSPAGILHPPCSSWMWSRIVKNETQGRTILANSQLAASRKRRASPNPYCIGDAVALGTPARRQV